MCFNLGVFVIIVSVIVILQWKLSLKIHDISTSPRSFSSASEKYKSSVNISKSKNT